MNILIVGVNWLGDTLCMTPAIRAVRRAHPDAFLAILVPPRCRPLLEGNPHVNEVILFDERGADRGPWGLWRFTQRLRRYRFDQALLFHRSLTRTLCVAWAGIPRRIGSATWKRRWLLTTAVPLPPKDTQPKAAHFLDVVRAAGIPSDGDSYDLTVSAPDRAAARSLLQTAGLQPGRPTVAIHAGANWRLKRWPEKLFARLGDRLAEQAGAQVFFVGSADDQPLAARIARRMRHPSTILCGRTTLPQLGALFQQVDVVISNDSGPLHIASAVGARTVGLFGPTSPALTGPPPSPRTRVLFGTIGCPVPCYRQWCPVNLCMRQVTPEQVVEVVREALRGTEGRP